MSPLPDVASHRGRAATRSRLTETRFCCGRSWPAAVLLFAVASPVAGWSTSGPTIAAPVAASSSASDIGSGSTAPRVTTTRADPRRDVDQLIAAHPGQTGSHVLDRGAEALLARAWLVDHARRSIDVQYFIWSSDNIGILASEALLRAARRGVHVRVLVDDLLLDAPDEILLALARHPNVDIRVYNPLPRGGAPLPAQALKLLTDFRGVNQRMHDKALIVDGELAITGGRNMADEYFDRDPAYNFRDRDALLIGAVVPTMRMSFERFWSSPLSVSVEQLFHGLGLMQPQVSVDAQSIQRVYRGLAAHAAEPGNFDPEVRAAIDAIPEAFPAIAATLAWGRVDFLCDLPGKNAGRAGLGGGGLTTRALSALVEGARHEVLIQSPYLVLSDPALALLARARARGVEVHVSTNSLASTDNLPAFGGYRNQRETLLRLGLRIHEYRPDPAAQQRVIARSEASRTKPPVFALHAKTLVVDRRTVYVGTFNLDPRSENLNTEVGVVIHDVGQAIEVAAALRRDMRADNAWDAAHDDPDASASLARRAQVRLWQLLPLQPLL